MTKLSEALRQYRKEKKLSTLELAQDLSVPKKTLEEWLYQSATPTGRYREMLEVKFPGIFEEEGAIPFPVAPHPPAPRATVSEVEAQVKMHLAEHHVRSLAELFQWFLFEATAEERNKFRSHVGRGWEEFTHLAHAMIGEKAFEVIKSEGKLETRRRP